MGCLELYQIGCVQGRHWLYCPVALLLAWFLLSFFLSLCSLEVVSGVPEPLGTGLGLQPHTQTLSGAGAGALCKDADARLAAAAA